MLEQKTPDDVAAAAPPAPDWLAALRRAVEAHPRRVGGVAEQLGVSRGYVSRSLHGHWPGGIAATPPRFIARVRAQLMAVACPYLQREITPEACAGYAGRPYARVPHGEVAHWRACRRCEHNPVTQRAAAAQITVQERVILRATLGAGAAPGSPPASLWTPAPNRFAVLPEDRNEQAVTRLVALGLMERVPTRLLDSRLHVFAATAAGALAAGLALPDTTPPASPAPAPVRSLDHA